MNWIGQSEISFHFTFQIILSVSKLTFNKANDKTTLFLKTQLGRGILHILRLDKLKQQWEYSIQIFVHAIVISTAPELMHGDSDWSCYENLYVMPTAHTSDIIAPSLVGG